MSAGAISPLTFKATVDLDQFQRDTAELGRMVESAYESVGGRLRNVQLPAPKMGPVQEQGGSAGAAGEFDTTPIVAASERVRGTVAGMSRNLKTTLGDVAADFGAKFSHLAPIFVELSKRIDAAIKFPAFDARIEKGISLFGRLFGLAPGKAAESFNRAAASNPIDAGRLFDLDDTNKKADSWARRAGSYAAQAWKKYGPKPVYGTGASTHVPPNMATAFLGRQNRRSNGRMAPGMMAPPPSPMARLMPAVKGSADFFNGVGGALKAYGATIRTYGQALDQIGSTTRSWIAKDIKLIQNLGGAFLNYKRFTNWFSSLGSVAKVAGQSLGAVKSPKIAFDPRQATILKGIGLAARGLGGAFSAALGPITALMAPFTIISKIGEFLGGGIAGASGLNETLNKTDVLLGDASAGAKAYADELAKNFGLSKKEVLDAEAGFGAILRNTGGLQGAALEDKVKALTGRATDIVSQQNVSMADATAAITQGLIGRDSDLLRKMGADYSAETVKAYALANGIVKVSKELTKEQEAAIRTQLILDGTASAAGDLANTANSPANAFRGLTGRLQELAVSIGAAVMPAMSRLLSLGNVVVAGLTGGFEAVKGTFMGFVEQAGKGFDFIASVLSNPTAALQVMKLVAIQTFANIVEWLGVIPDNFAQYGAWLGRNWSSLLHDIAINTLTAVENIGENFRRIGNAIAEFLTNPMGGMPAVNFTPLTQGFLSTTEKLPELIKPVLTDLSKDISKASEPIWKDYEKRRAEAMKPATPMTDEHANADFDKSKPEKEKKKKDKPYAEVAEVGSKEAYSSVIRSLYGVKTGNTQGQMLVVLNRIDAKLAEQAKDAKKPQPKPAMKANGAQS